MISSCVFCQGVNVQHLQSDTIVLLAKKNSPSLSKQNIIESMQLLNFYKETNIQPVTELRFLLFLWGQCWEENVYILYVKKI